MRPLSAIYATVAAAPSSFLWAFAGVSRVRCIIAVSNAGKGCDDKADDREKVLRIVTMFPAHPTSAAHGVCSHRSKCRLIRMAFLAGIRGFVLIFTRLKRNRLSDTERHGHRN